MNLQVIISTMNKKNIKELYISNKNITTDCLIINQCDENLHKKKMVI